MLIKSVAHCLFAGHDCCGMIANNILFITVGGGGKKVNMNNYCGAEFEMADENKV